MGTVSAPILIGSGLALIVTGASAVRQDRRAAIGLVFIGAIFITLGLAFILLK